MQLNIFEHLEDGVYAHFDGYEVLLAVNHHENVVIALEPSTARKLEAFLAECSQFRHDKQQEH